MTTAEFIKMVSQHQLGWGIEVCEATYDLAMLALQRGIPGDFVECGVYAGASSALMVRAIMDHWSSELYGPRPWGERKRVHLFDSFEGMPAADPMKDPEIWAAYGDKCKGNIPCPMDDVHMNMLRWGIPDELLVWHPGWFEQTVPFTAGVMQGEALRDKRDHTSLIAVLRLDGDLYSSTKVIMQHLYPLVSRGGWIIADDYDLTGCRTAINEVVNPAPMYWRKRDA